MPQRNSTVTEEESIEMENSYGKKPRLDWSQDDNNANETAGTSGYGSSSSLLTFYQKSSELFRKKRETLVLTAANIEPKVGFHKLIELVLSSDEVLDTTDNNQLDNLVKYIEENPLDFSRTIKTEDLESAVETAEFLRWWIIGISAILFSDKMKTVNLREGNGSKVMKILSHVVLFALNCNHTILSRVMPMFYNTLHQILSKSRKRENFPIVEVRLTQTGESGEGQHLFHQDIPLSDGKEYLYSDYVQVLLPLIVQSCQNASYYQITMLQIVTDMLQNKISKDTIDVAFELLAVLCRSCHGSEVYADIDLEISRIFHHILTNTTEGTTKQYISNLLQDEELRQNGSLRDLVNLPITSYTLKNLIYDNVSKITYKETGMLHHLGKLQSRTGHSDHPEDTTFVYHTLNSGLEIIHHPLFKGILGSTKNSKLLGALIDSWELQIKNSTTILRTGNNEEQLEEREQNVLVDSFLNIELFVSILAEVLPEMEVNMKSFILEHFKDTHLEGWLYLITSTLSNFKRFNHTMFKMIYMNILKTVEHFDRMYWLGKELSNNFYLEVICTTGWVFIRKVKDELPKNLPHFTKCDKETFACISSWKDVIAKSIRVITRHTFQPFRSFVRRYVLGFYAFPSTTDNVPLIRELLNLISERNYIFGQGLGASTPILFVLRIIKCEGLMRLESVKAALSNAIEGIPCITSSKSPAKDGFKNECEFCCTTSDGTRQINLQHSGLNANQIQVLLQSFQPIMRSNYFKTYLENFLVSICNHACEIQIDILKPFIEIAFNSECQKCKVIFSIIGKCLKESCNKQKIIIAMFRDFIPSLWKLHNKRTVDNDHSELLEIMMTGILEFSKNGPKDEHTFQEIVKFICFSIGQSTERRLCLRSRSLVVDQVKLAARNIISVFAEANDTTGYNLMYQSRIVITDYLSEVILRHAEIADWDNIRNYFAKVDFIGQFEGDFISYFLPTIISKLIVIEDKNILTNFLKSLKAQKDADKRLLFEYGRLYMPELIVNQSANIVRSVVEWLEEFGIAHDFKEEEKTQMIISVLSQMDTNEDRTIGCLPFMESWNLIDLETETSPQLLNDSICRMMNRFLQNVENRLVQNLNTICYKNRLVTCIGLLIKSVLPTNLPPLLTSILHVLQIAIGVNPATHPSVLLVLQAISEHLDKEALKANVTQLLAYVSILEDTPVTKTIDMILDRLNPLSNLHELYFASSRTTDERIKNAVSVQKRDNYGSFIKAVLAHIREFRFTPLRQLALLELQSILREDFLDFELSMDRNDRIRLVILLYESMVQISRIKTRTTHKTMLAIQYCITHMRIERDINLPVTTNVNIEQTMFLADGEIPTFLQLYLLELVKDAQLRPTHEDSKQLIKILIEICKIDDIDSASMIRALEPTKQEFVKTVCNSKVYNFCAIESYLPEISCPIYANSMSCYSNWLKYWVGFLTSCLTEEIALFRNLLKRSFEFLQHNIALCELILPSLTLYAFACAKPEQKREIHGEIVSILESANHQAFLEAVTPKETMKSECHLTENYDQNDVYKQRCTSTILKTLIHFRLVVAHSNNLASLFTKKITECAAYLLQILPKDKLAAGVMDTNLYMAIQLMEDHLREQPSLSNKIEILQQMYSQTTDLDAIEGLSKKHCNAGSWSSNLIEELAMNGLESTLKKVKEMECKNSSDLSLSTVVARLLLDNEDTYFAHIFMNAKTTEFPECESRFKESQLEAVLKLGKWEKVEKGVEVRLGDSITDISWSCTFPRLMYLLKSKNLEGVEDLVNWTNDNILPILTTFGELPHGHQRCLELRSIMQLLAEVSDVVLFLRDSKRSAPLEQVSLLKDMLSKWRKITAYLTTVPSVEFQVKRSRILILNALKHNLEIGLHPHSLCTVIESCYWKDISKDAQRLNQVELAHNCLRNGSKNLAIPELRFEMSKLAERVGDDDKAIKILEDVIKIHYPNIEKWTTHTSVETDKAQRKQCAEVCMQRAKLLFKRKLLKHQDLLKLFRLPSTIFYESERNLVVLGQYIDTHVNQKENLHDESLLTIVQSYCRSLQFGVEHLHETLPRVFSMWIECGNVISNNGTQEEYLKDKDLSVGDDLTSILMDQQCDIYEKMSYEIDSLMKLPPHFLLTCLDQLLSRLCVAHTPTWLKIQELVVHITKSLPSSMWNVMAGTASTNVRRRGRHEQILTLLRRDETIMHKVYAYAAFATQLKEICKKRVLDRQVINVNEYFPKLSTKNTATQNLIEIPFRCFTNSLQSFDGQRISLKFPRNPPTIQGVSDHIFVINSKTRPKRLTLRGSDGKEYGLLCKPADDIRKDHKCLEIAEIFNNYAIRDPDCRIRSLHLRTYNAIALDSKSSFIEWMPELKTFYSIVQELLQRKGYAKLRPSYLDNSASVEQRKDRFRDILTEYTPVFSDFFSSTFVDPYSYFTARLTFTRSWSTNAIFTYVLGIGDRHPCNILVDPTSGMVTNVDFNTAFFDREAGAPEETVQTRITQNAVNGFGYLGVEGSFRKSCEAALNLYRKKEALIEQSLKTFITNPLEQWKWDNERDVHGKRQSDRDNLDEDNNVHATKFIKRLKERIVGEYSVEAQVDSIIKESTSFDNLALMPKGWVNYV